MSDIIFCFTIRTAQYRPIRLLMQFLAKLILAHLDNVYYTLGLPYTEVQKCSLQYARATKVHSFLFRKIVMQAQIL